MPIVTSPDALALEKGLPTNIEAEKFVLGSVLLDDTLFAQVAGLLDAEDFAIEKHRRMFARMTDLSDRGERIEYLTLINELEKHGQLQAVDGISYIASLNEGLPRLASIDSYIKIVKDKSLLRRLIFTSQGIISSCIDESRGVDEILAEAESAVMKIGDRQLRTGLEGPQRTIENYPGGLQTFLDPSRRPKGLAGPFHKFEEMTTGMHSGQLIVIAARPAMGKTALALNIAAHIAMERPGYAGKPVAVFSLEMSKESLLTRMLCSEAQVDQHRFRGGYLNREERQRLTRSLNRLVQSKLFFDDSADTNIMEISAKCRRLRSEHGLALVVVDYLQLLGSKGKVESRVQEISAFSRGLKLLAKDLDIPILALSQLSRAPETRQGDHRPLLSDLRDSGSIEQDADMVCFIFREEVYKPAREDLHGIAELIVSKQRNGPTGKIKLAFLNRFAKFENLAEDIEKAGDDEPASGGADDDVPFDI